MAILKRGPQDDDELWEYVKTFWGLTIAREPFCSNHRAPFEAFADAFFARHPVTVWKASRGFGGKTTLLGALALTEGAHGAEVTVLGGSAAQSLRVKEVIQNECFAHPLAPKNLLTKMTRWDTELATGGYIRALTASQRSVRGPHPQRLRLDEIDEMELEILEAAQGQPMMRWGIPTQTVMSSTHQYPDQTMTIILERAKEKGWPIYEWCYRENLVSNNGWLPDEEIERKKIEIAKRMWEVEYELQEPSIQGRAIDDIAVDVMFDPDLGVFEGNINEFVSILPTNENIARVGWDFSDCKFVHGVDWAKEQDYTVISTFAVPYSDKHPWVLIAFERFNRMPWPVMVNKLDRRIADYPGNGFHDGTGIGNVVDDLLANDLVKPITMVGRVRDALFSEYISGIEGGRIKTPRIKWAYDEHRFCTVDDLWGSGHAPDSFVSGSLGWATRRMVQRPALVPIVSMTREGSPWSI